MACVFSCSIYYDKMATKQQYIRLSIELKKTVEINEEEKYVDGGRQQPSMVSLWKQVVANAASLTFNLSHLAPGIHSSLSSSTSNISVAFGGMTPGWPVAP